MRHQFTPYRCRLCSAATYRRLVHRGPDGAMVYSGLYRCSGCTMTFTDFAEWREGSARGEAMGHVQEAPASHC